jgi:hypothetical protein
MKLRALIWLCLWVVTGCAARQPGNVQALSADGTVSSACGTDAGSADDAASGEMCPHAAADESDHVTLARALREMVDLRHLTKLPSPAYASHMVTSFDRRSANALPGDPDWYANSDWLVLTQDQPATLLDVDGPGLLTRIWSATPAGVLRVYLDGETTPSIEAPMKDLLSGKVAPFTAPFAFVAAGGHNLYFPIPYATHCRITVTGESPKLYFHISYRSYAAGADVETYDDAALEAARCDYEQTARLLEAVTPIASIANASQVAVLDPHVSANASVALTASGTGSAIESLRIVPQSFAPEALRSTRLQISFDGEVTVDVPLGEIAATGASVETIHSLPISVEPETELVVRWPMPFAAQATITLSAADASATSASVEIVKASFAWDERSLHFHAGWRAPVTADVLPLRDHTLADLSGEGYYVGNVLNVINRNPGWWGEGDEKIFVDNEAFPSFFGTGTEDYFGYAWCANERFSTPYVGQPLGGLRKNFGYLSLYRFHVLDAIPFNEALRFDMEVQHWSKTANITLDATSFWYARPGGTATGFSSDISELHIPPLNAAEPSDIPEGPYRCGG